MRLVKVVLGNMLLLSAIAAALYVLLLQMQKPTDPTDGTPRDIVEIRNRITPDLRTTLSNLGLDLGAPVFMRIFKEEHVLEVWLQKDDAFQLFKTYDTCNYSGHLGPKLREGDRQSPEGFYHVAKSALNPNSSYHLSFNLGFPNPYDRARDRTGSYLMVHGDCVSVGCYAMTNPHIEEIYVIAEAALNAGQPFFRVHAFPFRMTTQRLAEEADNQWHAFWSNLKTGHDAFERDLIPPAVDVAGQDYVFEQS